MIIYYFFFLALLLFLVFLFRSRIILETNCRWFLHRNIKPIIKREIKNLFGITIQWVKFVEAKVLYFFLKRWKKEKEKERWIKIAFVDVQSYFEETIMLTHRHPHTHSLYSNIPRVWKKKGKIIGMRYVRGRQQGKLAVRW